MKNRPSAVFSNKFVTCLAKLRQTSTVQVGHEQFRQLLINTELKDIIGPFVSKMDTVDRPTERQKKQHAKLYMELIDHFGQEILLQNYYEKFMESLLKKTVCVSEVIGHLCKGYISRIHPLENTKNYAIYILSLFKNHQEIHKIIKQIAQTISPIIVKSLQTDMIQIIIDKMTLSRQKAEYIEAMMALVLALQDKFECQNLVQPVLAKNLKNQDWSLRKACVDICYSFMVVKEQIHSTLHQLIKELKYDKIKNVRDSVSNYESLYKQVYGQEQSFKPQIYSQKTVRQNPRGAKSPYRDTEHHKTEQDYPQSPNKILGKVRNQTFFKNAKDNNVIRVSEEGPQNLSGINSTNKTQIIKDFSQNSQVSMLPTRSLHLSQSPSLKSNTKRSSTKNLLPDQIKGNKSDQFDQKQSPKFNLNFDKLKHKQNQYKETEKQEKSYLSDFGDKISKKQTKPASYQITDKHLNLSLQSQENQRRQYMPIKKSELRNYQQKDEPIFKPEREQKRDERQQRQQKNTRVVTENNTYFIPKSTSSGVSTPSLKESFNHNMIKEHTASTQKPSMSNHFNSAEEGESFGSKVDLMQIKTMFDKFEQRVMTRLDKLQARVASLENSQLKLSFGKETQLPISNEKHKVLENLDDSAISIKNDHYFQYEDNNFLKKPQQNQQRSLQNEENEWLVLTQQDSHQHTLESNLIQKINEALRSHNIDQAYSLVLANNKQGLLMRLLQGLHIPVDKTVEECLMLEIKKQVGRRQVLKWLKNYLIEKGIWLKRGTNGAVYKLLSKMQGELMRGEKSRQRDVELLKTMVLNEMGEIFGEAK